MTEPLTINMQNRPRQEDGRIALRDGSVWTERTRELEPPPAAIFSPCRTWRYVLRRHFLTGERTVNFIMLNPSTADETLNDPTIRRCIGYAQRWGYQQLVVTNLFAFRATLPRDMKAAPDPVGPENDEHLLREAKRAALVVMAWGSHGAHRDRGAEVKRMLLAAGVPLHYQMLTQDQHPGHPLYLPADREPVVWREEGK